MSEEVTAPAPDAGQAAPAPAESWTSGFDDDMRGYIENKGFSTPADLANGYRNLEKLRGIPAEQLLQLPADVNDREAMQPVYNRLGMPEQVDGYTRAIPEEFNSEVFTSLAEKAHEVGLGDHQFTALQEVFTEQAANVIQAEQAQAEQAFDEWHQSNPEGFQAAARVMAEVGMTEEQVEGVLNGEKTALYDFLAKVGGRTNESTIVQGDQPTNGFSMSTDAAKDKIAALMADETFMKQYTSPSKQIREAAIKRMAELQKNAYG